jgi:hypothetical protein
MFIGRGAGRPIKGLRNTWKSSLEDEMRTFGSLPNLSLLSSTKNDLLKVLESDYLPHPSAWIKFYKVERRMQLVVVAWHVHGRLKMDTVFSLARITGDKEEPMGRSQSISMRLLYSAAQTNQEMMRLVEYEVVPRLKDLRTKSPIREVFRIWFPGKELKVEGKIADIGPSACSTGTAALFPNNRAYDLANRSSAFVPRFSK